MEWTLTYIISQVLTIIKYGILGRTYHEKNRNRILVLNFITNAITAVIFVLLKAWSGFATTGVCFLANIIFILDEKKNGKKEKNDSKDLIIIIILFILFLICSIITYEGFLSLFSIFAGMVFIYAIWQKKTIVYKFSGILTGILWMSYNIYIKSIFGIIFESYIFISSIIGFVSELKKNNKKS